MKQGHSETYPGTLPRKTYESNGERGETIVMRLRGGKGETGVMEKRKK